MDAEGAAVEVGEGAVEEAGDGVVVGADGAAEGGMACRIAS